MVNADSVILAINAGIKLGQKINEVLIDETVERPFILPLGNLFGDVQTGVAVNYFMDHPELTRPGAPYAGLANEDKLKAYKTILTLQKRLDDPEGISGSVEEIILNLNQFEQFKEGFNSRPPIQRVLGTVVEIAVDYFASTPNLLDGDSDSKKVLRSFISHLDDIKFAETPPTRVVRDILLASLRTLNGNVTLLDDNKRLTALVGGITQSFIDDYEGISSAAGKIRRGQFIKRIASSIMKGGVSTFTENIDLYLGSDAKARTLVKSTLTQVIAGIDGKEDLFTNESLELIFKSALHATAENAELFTNNDLLKDLIEGTVQALTQSPAKKVFSQETVAAVLHAGLEAVRDNIETLIDTRGGEQKLLANTVSAIAAGLATSLSGGGTISDLLSKRQLEELTKQVFQEVAKNPECLIGDASTPKRAALAQIIGSIAKALEGNPKSLLTGDGFIQLVRIALQTAVKNADKLLDLDSTNVKTNVLFKVTRQAADALLNHADPRGLISREVVLSILENVLPVVSANLDGLTDGTPQPVKATISRALDLAMDTLQNRLNGENLPLLVRHFLKAVLRGDLNLEEATALTNAADEFLKAA